MQTLKQSCDVVNRLLGWTTPITISKEEQQALSHLLQIAERLQGLDVEGIKKVMKEFYHPTDTIFLHELATAIHTAIFGEEK